MNIQLRDSKHLQDTLLKESRRNALPKAQLHPELLAGRIDGEGFGFVVHSENASDVRLLELFMDGLGSCTASWKMSGKDHALIPSELIFAFDAGSKLVARTQGVADVSKLTSIIPGDQRHKFNATYAAGKVSLVRDGEEKTPASSTLSLADLQTLAPQLGIVWDTAASNETNIARIQDAIEKKGKKQVKPQPVTT